MYYPGAVENSNTRRQGKAGYENSWVRHINRSDYKSALAARLSAHNHINE